MLPVACFRPFVGITRNATPSGFNLQICEAHSFLFFSAHDCPHSRILCCCLQETELRRLQERCRQLDKEAVITRCRPCCWCHAAMRHSAAGLQQQDCGAGNTSHPSSDVTTCCPMHLSAIGTLTVDGAASQVL